MAKKFKLAANQKPATRFIQSNLFSLFFTCHLVVIVKPAER